MTWAECKGHEYTIPISATYWVKTDVDDVSEAEDKAIELMEKELTKNEDVKEVNCFTEETMTSFSGYSVKLKVNMVVYAVARYAGDAWDEVVDLVENIELPNNVELICTGQFDLIREGERVFLMHGDAV